MDMILDIILFTGGVWFAVWMMGNIFGKMNVASPEDKEINLYMEKVEQHGKTTYLAWWEGGNEFVCQAPTEKELHARLFEIFEGREINMRVDEDTMLKISFEVFEKPKS